MSGASTTGALSMRGAPLESTLALLVVSCNDTLVPITLPEGSRQFFPERVFRA